MSVSTLARTFVRESDRDALAANVVEIDLIFLLNLFAQVLHRHVFLRQFDFERAALLLNFRQASALFAQIFFARSHFRFLRLLLADQFRGLRVHLIALVLQRFNFLARLGDFRIRLRFASEKGFNFACGVVQPNASVHACDVRAAASAGGTKSKAVLRWRARLWFRSKLVFAVSRCWRRLFQSRVEFGDLRLQLALAVFEIADLRGQALRAFDCLPVPARRGCVIS